MTMEKKTAAVIFGGQSSEHVVSCMSAANVIDRINTDKYNLILIGITQEGKWLKVDSVQAIRDESWRKGTVSAAILPDAEKKCALFMENGTMTEVKLDVVFPVRSWPLRRGRHDPGTFGAGKDTVCGLRSTGIRCFHG